MARVLIGWELGANRGHISSILPVANALLAMGHDVHLGLQQLDTPGLDADPRFKLWQAPAWPRLFATRAPRFDAKPVSMADILGRLGLDTPGMLAALISGWDSILSVVDSQLVIAEFAPALLCAARGRMTTARMGTGFATPPAHLDRFPALADGDAQFREDALLDIADADLRSVGRPALAALPAIAAADHDLVRSFAEFDPYAGERNGGYVRAAEPPFATDRAALGLEVFCYLPGRMGTDLPIWQGLANSGKPIRLHVPQAGDAHLAMFRKLGFAFEPRPVSFEKIAARSRMVVSHGGHGFVTASALCGLPQLIAGYDLEKMAMGKSIVANGLGRYASLFDVNPTDLGKAIAAMHENDALAKHCGGFARELAARPIPSVEQRLVEIVDAL